MFFKHSRKRALIVTVSRYDKLRAVEGKSRYSDLPETVKDQETIIAGLQRLGFSKDTMTVLTDPSWHVLNNTLSELSIGLLSVVEDNINTLTFVYYAGHGLSDNNLWAQLNEEMIYPLEKQLRSLAKIQGSYVIGLFDCCREKMAGGLGARSGAVMDFSGGG